MPAVISGVTVPNGHTMMVDGQSCHRLMENGVEVWYKEVAGEEIFDGVPGDYIFTVPNGITEVTFCLGGGGGGGSSPVETGNPLGSCGGYSGGVETATIVTTPGEEILVTLGAGGLGGTNAGGAWNGFAGSASVFGATSAAGGAGGTFGIPLTGYAGNGAARETCAGSFNDGVRHADTNPIYGGQAGVFGNGGNGVQNQAGIPGGRGAGGGGATSANGTTSRAGQGGDGWLKVTWGDA